MDVWAENVSSGKVDQYRTMSYLYMTVAFILIELINLNILSFISHLEWSVVRYWYLVKKPKNNKNPTNQQKTPNQNRKVPF